MSVSRPPSQHEPQSQPQPETLLIDADEATGFPNSRLPVLIYRQCIHCQSIHRQRIDTAEADLAARFEAMFTNHRWPSEWRYGLFDFDHFHSTAHEALGVFRGQAHIRLGGPNGSEHDIAAGDVLVLPAGVGHANLSSSADFTMVGAYPPEQRWEVERGDPDPDSFAAACRRVAAVAMPDSDPVGGSLVSLWR